MLAFAGVALVLARLCGLPLGDATLLAVLASSASYIAVPAAARIAIPKADPSMYIGLALAVTFPFNVVVGIALYLRVAQALERPPDAHLLECLDDAFITLEQCNQALIQAVCVKDIASA